MPISQAYEKYNQESIKFNIFLSAILWTSLIFNTLLLKILEFKILLPQMESR